ncbi:MAG TPA: hypothetical protein VFW13_03655, partial [Phenylobacterium sp.]|nr:hypothetical protein [Phenylobacterium sp.]
GEAHGYLVARGRGRGVGFNFTANKVAVVWDQGAWGLLYGLDELIGAEVIVDFQVVGRVHRGEARRALDAFGAEERVALRLVFDDLSQPDFVLDLWLPKDAGRRDELPPDEAVAEANRWLARIEALLRRPSGPRRAAQVVATPGAVEVAAMGQHSSAPSPPPFELQAAEDEDDEF